MTNSSSSKIVEIIDGVKLTTSLEIAKYFNKPHYDIVVDIESLNIAISTLLTEPHFRKIPDQEETVYYVTKEGLLLLLLFGFSCRGLHYLSQVYLLCFDFAENPPDPSKIQVESLEDLLAEPPPQPPEYPKVEIVKGVAMTTSLEIAKFFDKRHDDVLKAIRNLQVSELFSHRNFAGTSYPDQQGKERPMYRLTKDGFIFLVMGFTGEKAAQIKEAYIAAFNQMEAELTRINLVCLKFFLLNAITESEQAEMRFSRTLQQHEKQLQKYRTMYEQIRRDTVEMVSKIYALSAKGFLQTDISAITGYREDLIILAMQLKTF